MEIEKILYMVFGAIFGFLVKFAHSKAIQQQVSLSHQIDNPFEFTVVSPPICVQAISIWNKGKLSANNLKVILNRQIIEKFQAQIGSSAIESFKEEKNDNFITLEFKRILPKEKLTIGFKSNAPLDNNFLHSIKSDEMISSNSVEAKQIKNFWLQILLFVVLTTGGVYIGAYGLPHLFEYKRAYFLNQLVDLKVELNSHKYKPGSLVSLKYDLQNISDKNLKNFSVGFNISGIEGSHRITRKSILLAKGNFLNVFDFEIPNEQAKGDYTLDITTTFESNGETILDCKELPFAIY